MTELQRIEALEKAVAELTKKLDESTAKLAAGMNQIASQAARAERLAGKK
jgi:X-X-X-Leu-X-X-Gly heptad repeat protein